MVQRRGIWSAAIGIALACILSCASTTVAPSDGTTQETGFYLIAAEAASAAVLPQPNNAQQVVLYANKFIADPADQPPLYLLLSSKPDVPLQLARAPKFASEGANGFPELQLELTDKAARNLETLTREHLGQQVAFMIDGEPVTIHKIRSVIADGHFRLSRCTDTACQYIYSRLKNEP